MGSEPAIRVENLGKKYQLAHGQPRQSYRTLRETLTGLVRRGPAVTTEEFWALNDVSFEVQPGEVVGIIGRNGAGKSTLLKILSRITKPTKGRVELNGRVGSLLEVGTGFHPELTGRENVYLNGSILGMSRREITRKFDEIVAFAEVEKFLDTPVKRYSSGMYVRLAFAVAAHLEPEILIVDEVLAVGDAGFQKKCLRKMRECATSGRTVLLVSHHMATVRELCDRCVWLADGRVRMHSSVQDVVSQYLDDCDVQTQADTWVDLSGAARAGRGPARLLRASYRGDETGLPPESDGPITIDVEVLVPDGYPLTSMIVECQLADKYQHKLLAITTFERREPLRLAAGTNRITFTVDRVHLAPGQYALTLTVGDLTDIHDAVGPALWVQIAEPGGEKWGWTDQAPVTRKAHFTLSQPALSAAC